MEKGGVPMSEDLARRAAEELFVCEQCKTPVRDIVKGTISDGEWHICGNCPKCKLVMFLDMNFAPLLSAGKDVEGLEKHPAMLALEGLTPGGSEYVNDVERCVDHIRNRRNSTESLLKALVLQNKELRAQPAEKAGEVKRMRDAATKAVELIDHENQRATREGRDVLIQALAPTTLERRET
jgi:hypothetical protein